MPTVTNLGPCVCCGAAVPTECCPDPLPSTLYLTVTDGDCDCLPAGTYVMTYSAAGWGPNGLSPGTWQYVEEVSCGIYSGGTVSAGSPPVSTTYPGMIITLACVQVAGVWQFLGGVRWYWKPDPIGTPNVMRVKGLDFGPHTTLDCDPLYVLFDSGTISQFGGTPPGFTDVPCPTTLPTTMEVTE